jgi:hypothetical protein
MVLWQTTPANHDHPKRLADYFPAHAHTVSERGVELLMSHVFMALVGKASGKINVTFEAIEATWICIDWWYEGKTRSMKINQMPQTDIMLATVYPPERGTPSPGGRWNDVFDLSISINRPQQCAYYSDDRDVFANRLLRTAHKMWVETWRLMEEVQGHPRRKWPVKLWIHGQPEIVYQITGEGNLERVEGHPTVDERVIMAQEVVPIG